GCLPETQESGPAPTPAPAEELPNRAPMIDGIATGTVMAGNVWQFQPAVSDADGDLLSFAAIGLPGWANLDTQTGLVSGIPTENAVGTTTAIVITVSDGEASTSLAPFSITVTSASPS